MESEVDLQNEKIKTKPHDLFNLKRVSVDLFAFLGFGTFREYTSSASKFSLETRETFIFFVLFLFLLKRKLRGLCNRMTLGGRALRKAPKIPRVTTIITTLFMSCSIWNSYSATSGFWPNSQIDNPSVLKVPLRLTLSYLFSFLLSCSTA